MIHDETPAPRVMGSGSGGPRPHNWVSSLRACPTAVHGGPSGRDGRGLPLVDHLFRPSMLRTNYTSCPSEKHLMCMCFPHASHGQHVVLMRQCVHKRRLAKKLWCTRLRDGSGGCRVVEIRAAEVLPLEDFPLEFQHSGLVVYQTQCLGSAKGIPRRVPHHEGTHQDCV